MAETQLNGITIHYEDSGGGPCVFLTHGYAAAGAMWDPQRKPLNDAGYRLVSWDMRGHAETESPDDPAQYSEALTIADMTGLMDVLGVRKAVVGGLSLGGYMSLAFQLAHPDRVQALVLCDTGPGYRSEDPRAKWNRMAEKSALNFEEKGLDAAGRSPEVQAAVKYHRSPIGLAHSARGMLAQADSRVIDHLPEIDVPTLIMVGERDEPYLDASRYMQSKIPGARLEVIPDAGHAANMDQPEAFNRVLLEFLVSMPDLA
jgi:pimeloyl-ACP methyl ester carboxylesterase